jgi:uncharacterized protein VirK/YbjX
MFFKPVRFAAQGLVPEAGLALRADHGLASTGWREALLFEQHIEPRAPLRGVRGSVTIASGVDAKLAPMAYWRELIKLRVRAQWHRGATRRWLELLNAHPMLGELVPQCPRMLYKIYRPYLTNTLPINARLAVLAAHYDCLLGRGLGPLVLQASRAALPLADVEGKDGLRYRIDLRAAGTLEREGELVLQLSVDGHTVYSVAFTFSAPGVVSIGCIQGANGEAAREQIRLATRALHGMRPKQLLVSLVRQLGFAFDCDAMQLVSNANRVVRGAMRQGRVQADYDQLWRELGAQVRPDGDFTLPCQALVAPELAAYPSRKRSEVRQRHAMFEQLSGAVNARLGPPRRAVLCLAYNGAQPADGGAGAQDLRAA